jgi:hypothetical protein
MKKYSNDIYADPNGVKRLDFIKHLIKNYNFLNYLEIGVNDGICIRKINAPHKDGVDPSPGAEVGGMDVPEINYPVTSDDFFNFSTSVTITLGCKSLCSPNSKIDELKVLFVILNSTSTPSLSPITSFIMFRLGILSKFCLTKYSIASIQYILLESVYFKYTSNSSHL